jgi:hypothetical protein
MNLPKRRRYNRDDLARDFGRDAKDRREPGADYNLHAAAIFDRLQATTKDIPDDLWQDFLTVTDEFEDSRLFESILNALGVTGPDPANATELVQEYIQTRNEERRWERLTEAEREAEHNRRARAEANKRASALVKHVWEVRDKPKDKTP